MAVAQDSVLHTEERKCSWRDISIIGIMIKAPEHYLMCSDEGRLVRKRRHLKGSRWKGEGGPLSGTECLWHGNRLTQACFQNLGVWCSAWTGLCRGDKMRSAGGVYLPTTQTEQTWRRRRHTAGEIFNKVLWELEEMSPHWFPVAHSVAGDSQLAGALPGLTPQWVAYSRLTPRLHLAALLSAPHSMLPRCRETLLLLFLIHPHQFPEAGKGT